MKTNLLTQITSVAACHQHLRSTLLIIAALNPLTALAATNYTVIKSFNAISNEYPSSALIEGRDFRLYGTTFGDNLNPSYGTVYAINKDGSGYAVLHSFNGTDGRWTTAALAQDSNGYLYGTAPYGGDADDGVIFKLYQDGTRFSLVHSFGSTAYDGQYPSAALLLATDGLLYGSTQSGGVGGSGSIFKIATNGTSYATILSFFGGFSSSDGSKPNQLIEARDGFLYGTTSQGGTYGKGTIFKVAKDGTQYSILHHFTGNLNDGWEPDAGVIEAPDGKLYGTTFYGGIVGKGIFFTLKKDGSSFQLLWSFYGDIDPAYPLCKLVTGTDGGFYGTSSSGGDTCNCGVLFSWDSADGIYYQHTFKSADGSAPQSGLIQGTDGAFYGTTQFGGAFNLGVVFRWDPLPPYIKFTSLTGSHTNIHVQLQGTVGRSFTVQASTNLLNWTNFITATITNGQFVFNDPATTKFSRRFYRAFLGP